MSTATAAFPEADQRSLPSLTSNFVWILAGNIVYSASQWAMLSLLAKRGSPSTVGIFAFALAVSAPVFMFSNLQLRSIQVTDAHSRYTFADFFVLRSICTLVALLFIGGMCLFGKYNPEVRVIVLALGFAKAFESWSDVIAGLLQKKERLDLATRALSVRGVLSLAIFAAVFVATRNLSLTCIAMALAWAATVLLYDVALARSVLRKGEVFFRASTHQLWTLFKKSLPLGTVMTLISLNASLPRYIIVHDLGAGPLGIFASLSYLLTAVNLLTFALGNAATARMATMFVAGDLRQFRLVLARLVSFGLAIGVVTCAVAFMFGSALLRIVYGPVYSYHQGLLLILAATAGVSTVATFMGFAATSAQSFRAQVPVILAMTITTLLGSWRLVPALGLNGAGIALLAATCVQLAGLTFVTWRATKVRQEFA